MKKILKYFIMVLSVGIFLSEKNMHAMAPQFVMGQSEQCEPVLPSITPAYVEDREVDASFFSVTDTVGNGEFAFDELRWAVDKGDTCAVDLLLQDKYALGALSNYCLLSNEPKAACDPECVAIRMGNIYRLMCLARAKKYTQVCDVLIKICREK